MWTVPLQQTRAVEFLLNISIRGLATRLQTFTGSTNIMYHVQKTIVRFWFWIVESLQQGPGVLLLGFRRLRSVASAL
jgi:hypothetical protein